MSLRLNLIVMLFIIMVTSCHTQRDEVNVYSGRHYKSDEELFRRFTEETGIKINLIKADSDQLINRILLEGEQTQADLFITADASRLSRAVDHGILYPINDQALLHMVPKNLREPNGHWLGLTKRARIIVYHKERINPQELSTYEDLADDKWKGRILVRSSQSHYNQSLLASIIAANGHQSASDWAEKIVDNMAQPPRGNDRDQVKAIVAGTGDLAIINSYYLGLLMRSTNAEERRVASEVGLFFPNQEDRGTHINVSGMGIVASSKNKNNAIKLIRYLLQKDAQEYLANENFEYPVLPQAELPMLLQNWGAFKADSLNIGKLGDYLEDAMLIFNKAGWQ